MDAETAQRIKLFMARGLKTFSDVQMQEASLLYAQLCAAVDEEMKKQTNDEEAES